MGKVLVDELAEVRLCGFALAFDRLQNHLHSFLTRSLRTAFLRFPARCRLGLVVQVCDPLIKAMRNSDPRVRIVLVHRLNSDFHSIFTL